MEKRPEETMLTCSCSTDIIAEASNAGLLSQFLRVVFHLQGSPHNMTKPTHIGTTSSGDELFKDKNNQSHVVVIRRKK